MRAFRTVILAFILLLSSAAPALAGDLDLNLQFSLGPSPGLSLDTASITYTGEHWTWAAGRQQIHWGPGEFGQMVLGPTIGLDALSFSASYYGFTWRQFWADLDGPSDRRLFGHRLEYAGGDLTIGLTETMVLVGDIPKAFYLPAPWPYLLTQWFLLVDDEMDNTTANGVLGADICWHPFDQMDIYAEIVIDDYPTLPPATAPARAGGLVGLAYRNYPNEGELRIEYSRLNKFTYCHFTDQTDYVYHGAPLGHWIGPDADMLAAQYSWNPRDNARLSVRGFLQRHGEGQLGDRWDPTDGWAPQFLTGEAEWWGGLRLGAESHLSDHVTLSGYIENALVYTAESERIWTFRFEPAGRLALSWAF